MDSTSLVPLPARFFRFFSRDAHFFSMSASFQTRTFSDAHLVRCLSFYNDAHLFRRPPSVTMVAISYVDFFYLTGFASREMFISYNVHLVSDGYLLTESPS
jgi:hypothetical protein